MVEVSTGFAGFSVFHRVVAHPHGTFFAPSGPPVDSFVVGQVVKITSEGEVHVFAFRNDGSGAGQGQFVVSGYLEDRCFRPAPSQTGGVADPSRAVPGFAVLRDRPRSAVPVRRGLPDGR